MITTGEKKIFTDLVDFVTEKFRESFEDKEFCSFIYAHSLYNLRMQDLAEEKRCRECKVFGHPYEGVIYDLASQPDLEKATKGFWLSTILQAYEAVHKKDANCLRNGVFVTQTGDEYFYLTREEVTDILLANLKEIVKYALLVVHNNEEARDRGVERFYELYIEDNIRRAYADNGRIDGYQSNLNFETVKEYLSNQNSQKTDD